MSRKVTISSTSRISTALTFPNAAPAFCIITNCSQEICFYEYMNRNCPIIAVITLLACHAGCSYKTGNMDRNKRKYAFGYARSAKIPINLRICAGWSNSWYITRGRELFGRRAILLRDKWLCRHVYWTVDACAHGGRYKVVWQYSRHSGLYQSLRGKSGILSSH